MPDISPRLQLVEALGSDLISVLVQIHDNFDRIDDYLPTFICTVATRPTGANRYQGMLIYETDTDREYIWNGTVWKQLLDSQMVSTKWTGNTTTLTSATAIVVNQSLDLQVGSNFSIASSSRVVAAVAGTYKVSGFAEFDLGSAVNPQCLAQVRKNAAGSFTGGTFVCDAAANDAGTNSNNFNAQTPTRITALAAGEYFELFVRGVFSGGTMSVIGTNSGANDAIETGMMIERVA